MAKFLLIAVAGRDKIFSAENVITVDRASSTTTTITYCTGSASTDVVTLTHAADAGFLVEAAINTTILRAHNPTEKKNTAGYRVTLPLAISAFAIS